MTSPAVDKYEPVSLDIKYLTPRELKDIMDNAGMSAADLDNPMATEDPGKAMAAIAWVVTRRTHPGMTLEDAWDVPVALDEVPVDPTNASN